jgi:hypothetical protein
MGGALKAERPDVPAHLPNKMLSMTTCVPPIGKSA